MSVWRWSGVGRVWGSYAGVSGSRRAESRRIGRQCSEMWSRGARNGENSAAGDLKQPLHGPGTPSTAVCGKRYAPGLNPKSVKSNGLLCRCNQSVTEREARSRRRGWARPEGASLHGNGAAIGMTGITGKASRLRPAVWCRVSELAALLGVCRMCPRLGALWLQWAAGRGLVLSPACCAKLGSMGWSPRTHSSH